MDRLSKEQGKMVDKCGSVVTWIFKPGARGQRPRVPGFLKLLWFARWYVCVSAPKAINNQWRDMV